MGSRRSAAILSRRQSSSPSFKGETGPVRSRPQGLAARRSQPPISSARTAQMASASTSSWPVNAIGLREFSTMARAASTASSSAGTSVG